MSIFDEAALADSLSKYSNIKVISLQAVTGGYTLAKRYIARFENGSSAFVKIATNNDTTNWLRAEHNFYSQSEYGFHPKMLGWKDNQSETFILLEDLSKAEWSYIWTKDKVKCVLDSLDKVGHVQSSINLPSIRDLHSDLFCWNLIEKDPNIFINSNLADKDILSKKLPSLKKLADSANIDGSSLVHMDIRSDNTCFFDNRALFVDWNHACIGNAKMDILFWLPSLYLEGGPAPWDFELNEPELLALILGYFAYNASLETPHSGSELRNFQRKQLEVVYEWINRL